jgi:hypothetical protein
VRAWQGTLDPLFAGGGDEAAEDSLLHGAVELSRNFSERVGHIEPRRPDDREGVLREPIQSICPAMPQRREHYGRRPRQPAIVEGAQMPVMNLYEEPTTQLGGASGSAVAVPGISSYDLAAQHASRSAGLPNL